MPRSKRLNAKSRAFLASFSVTASITRAAEAAKIDRSLHYQWLRDVPEYKDAFAVAQEQAAHALEDEAVRRAHEGVVEPIYYQGLKCGVIRRFSDGLAMFLLRGLMPEKYGAKTEITGKDGAPIAAALTVTFVKPE